GGGLSARLRTRKRAGVRVMTGRDQHSLVESERIERMRRAIETMEPGDRAIFERVRFMGLDYARIANELGVTIDEVERGFALALAHIDRVFERDP
ncbi:MAG: sigma-70 family RNA polymerase sigma factor, partial [Afipia sp.]|nr:sigma-70 family RNA polymerase sigma factor [Afipia sp.]